MAAAIAAVPYAAAVKVGLQFKRRFWEEDEHIYGGISYTDLPVAISAIPIPAITAAARECCSAPISGALPAMEFTAVTPGERVQKAVNYGSRIHPQYARNSITASPSPGIDRRSPWAVTGCGCSDSRAEHYDDLCRIDGRIALAGEHASFFQWLAGRRGWLRRSTLSGGCISARSLHGQGRHQSAQTLGRAALIARASADCRCLGPSRTADAFDVFTSTGRVFRRCRRARKSTAISAKVATWRMARGPSVRLLLRNYG